MVTAMIVCCYGNFDEGSRTRIEMNGYKQYLKGVARLIVQRRPDYIVLCGGLTRPELGVSEAASVLPALETYLKDSVDLGRQPHELPNVTFLLEENSLDTPQNLRFGFDRLWELGETWRRVIVVSDEVRKVKVWVLMQRLFGPSGDSFFHWFGSNLRWDTIGLPRQDIYPNSTRRRQLVQASRYLFLPSNRFPKSRLLP